MASDEERTEKGESGSNAMKRGGGGLRRGCMGTREEGGDKKIRGTGSMKLLHTSWDRFETEMDGTFGCDDGNFLGEATRLRRMQMSGISHASYFGM